VRFRLQSLLVAITAFALILGSPLVIVGGFGTGWWRVVLDRLSDNLWYLPVIVSLIISCVLVWTRRRANPRAAGLALYGIGGHLAIWYFNFIYNLWLEKVSRNDPAVFDDPESVLGIWPVIYVGVESFALASCWLLITGSLLVAMKPDQG
jgi:hypothetical protein